LKNITKYSNPKWTFLNEINDEYQELRKLYRKDEDSIDEDSVELKRKGIELIANHLKAKETSRILKYHTQLSIALGRPIGMLEKDTEFDYMS
jgi:hypothetical protein